MFPALRLRDGRSSPATACPAVGPRRGRVSRSSRTRGAAPVHFVSLATVLLKAAFLLLPVARSAVPERRARGRLRVPGAQPPARRFPGRTGPASSRDVLLCASASSRDVLLRASSRCSPEAQAQAEAAAGLRERPRSPRCAHTAPARPARVAPRRPGGSVFSSALTRSLCACLFPTAAWRLREPFPSHLQVASLSPRAHRSRAPAPALPLTQSEYR